jgi:hypothetical protein
MQGDGANPASVEMLVDLEPVGFVIYAGDQGLAQGWEAVAVDGYHRAVHLVDPADGVCRSRATDGGGDKRRL